MFDRRFSLFIVVSALVSFVFLTTLTGCGGSTPAVGSISVTANATTVDGTDATTVTATVANDRNSAGVTWTASAGTLSGSTTTSTTLTAPAATSSQQTITVTATSVADTSKTGTATITVPAAPAITSLTTAQQSVAVGTAYSVTLAGTGGVSPYKNWALTSDSGSLPPCLSLSSAGVLSSPSTPTAACVGVYSGIKFKMTDSGTSNALAATSSAQTITVTGPTIAFSPTLPQGAVGTAYTGSVAATGALGATTYSFASGALPADLSLNTSTGVITGTPKAADVGTATFTVSVVDAFGDTATSGTMSITIAAAPAITFGSAPSATATFNVAYTSAVTASGGAGTLTYSLASGALPPDLSLSTSGAITGTPKAADIGTFTFAVKATDIYGDSATSGNYSIVVDYPAVTIAPAAGSLPMAIYGQSYSRTLTAAGGSGTGYTWTVNGLPANGLSYTASGATLTVSGPASSTGTVNFTASVKDDANNTNSGGALAYSIRVYSAVTLPSTNPDTLPSTATANLAYNGVISASGGSGYYSWTVTGLSDGLSSSSSGGTLTISGTPTSASNVTFTASVTDTTTNITAGPITYSINVYATVTLPATNPSTLGPAIVSTPYSGTITAAGGSGNYSWTVTGLPGDGLSGSVSGGTLTISGTPSSSLTTVSFTAKVTDTTTSTSSGPYNYTVTVYNPVTLDASALPTIATVNTAYTGSISASGGSGTGYTWTVTGLPADGLNYSATDGTLNITGTPTSAQAIQFTAKATDSAGNAAGPTSYTINAYNALTLPSSNPSTLGPATINLSYTGTVVASGGSGNYSWTVTGFPQNGLNYSTSGGTLTVSGPPSSTTTVTFTAKVTDTTTNTSVGPYNYSVSVYSGVTLPSPNPATLGPADASSVYSGTIVVAGGSGNYSWTITGLPADGLSSSTSGATLTVSGTPTSAQTVQFTAKVTDTTSNLSAGPFTYSIVVNGPLSLPTPDPSSLPANGYTNVSYTGYINASGGSGSYSWSVTGLPSDSLNVSGGTNGSTLTISGTPTSATTVTFNVTLTDTVTNATVTQNGYTITISNPTPVSLPAPSSSVPGSVTVNQSYNAGINASGGVSPYTWSINGTSVGSSCYSLSNGTLCATSSGGNTLMLSGTPNATGTVSLTNVKVTDSANSSDTKSYTITVSPVSTMQITINGIPQGMVNMPYTFGDLSITGGVSPYTVTYQNAPAGLSLQSGTWKLVGTPTASGSTTVTVKATDSTTPVAQQQTATFTLPVVPLTVAANNSEIKGQYACYMEQNFDGGVTGGAGKTLYRGGAVMAIAADGNGNITGGEMDTNDPKKGYESASTWGALSGSYVVGSDHRGYFEVLPASVAGKGTPGIDAIAGGNLNSSGQFSEFAFVGMDDAGSSPSGKPDTGHCYLQNTTGLSGMQPSGGAVWEMRGEDNQGNLEAQAGSGQWSGGAVSGVIDMVDAGTYQGPMNISGSTTSVADAYGRMTQTIGPAGQPSEANPSVMYMTNNAVGEALIMSANPHNAANNADFLIGEARAQNAAHVAAAYPFNGPAVFYTSGLDSDVATYNAQLAQLTGSSSATSINVHQVIENNSGTLKTPSPGTLSYTTSTPSGRTTLTGQSGIIFYIYDTNSAVALFAEPGGGSVTTTESQIGWVEPQTAPTSGAWAVSNLAASYFMSQVSNGDYNSGFQSGVFGVERQWQYGQLRQRFRKPELG